MNNSLKSEVFETLCFEKINNLLDEGMNADARYKAFNSLINSLYGSGRINFEEVEILEAAPYIVFDLFGAILDKIPEVVLKF